MTLRHHALIVAALPLVTVTAFGLLCIAGTVEAIGVWERMR